MTDLSPRQQDTLLYIMQFIQEFGFPPSIRDLCAGLSVSSPSTIHYNIEALTKKGYIEWPFGRDIPRGYKVVGYEVRLEQVS